MLALDPVLRYGLVRHRPEWWSQVHKHRTRARWHTGPEWSPPGRTDVPMTTATSAPTRPKPAISMEMRWIGPDEAQALLGTITKQRSLRRSHLNALAADMEHNRWEDSHQAVALNTNGALCDGQHRLTTIVETGIGQWLWVATGVSEDAMGVIDTAAQRSAADM